MPVAFVREDAVGGRIPLVQALFVIGRASTADLVLADERLRERHAVVTRQKGEHVLATEGDALFDVNGRPVSFITLRTGDRIRFLAAGEPVAPLLRFENRMADSYVPPDASTAAAWMSHPAFDAQAGPDAWGRGRALGGRDHGRLRRVHDEAHERDLVVKVLGPVRSHADGDHHLRLVSRLAGAPHPGLARVVEGGLAPGRERPVRWVATEWVEGLPASEVLATQGVLALARVLPALRVLARGLAHLHARGLVHRDVTPSNVILEPGPGAVLIDPGHAIVSGVERPADAGVIGTPGYLAPEAVLASEAPPSPAADVHGLAAVGYALLVGTPPAAGCDVLETLARAATEPPRPRDLGVDLPPALEGALLEGLARDPAARPTARDLDRRFAFAEAALGLGGSSR